MYPAILYNSPRSTRNNTDFVKNSFFSIGYLSVSVELKSSSKSCVNPQ